MSKKEDILADYVRWFLAKGTGDEKSQVEIYKESHPNCADSTAKTKAYLYFRNGEKLFDSLPFSRQCDLFNVGKKTTLAELGHLMKATKLVITPEEKEVPDNTTRVQAVKIAAEINGMTGKNAKLEETEESDDKLVLRLVDGKE